MNEKQLKLRQLANIQGGYFTSTQARKCGYDLRNVNVYLASNEWKRIAHGIYTLAGVPSQRPGKDELHFWLLWTIGRQGDHPRGALAYETALYVCDLSDLTPHKIHLAVPKNFAVMKKPEGIVLHREDRPKSDFIEYEGLRVVRPIVTIIDLLREGRVSMEHIERGFKDGVQTGLISLTENTSVNVSAMERNILNQWLKEVQ